MTDEVTDLVVLGGGSGGYAAALRAAQLGLTVTLIERDRLGGTCLHRGCVPTKAMLHAGELVDAIAHGRDWGIDAALHGIDAQALTARTQQVVSRLFAGLTGLVSKAGINLVTGEGRLVTDDDGAAIQVGDQRYRGHTIVLATGARSRQLPEVAVDGERIVTSTEALGLSRIPSSVAVIGGGVIGVEFASLWRSLGAEVHVLEMADRLLLGEDPDIAEQFTRAFTRRGINVRLGVELGAVRAEADRVRITLGSGPDLEVDTVLVAVGRSPVSAELAAAGVEVTAAGHLVTDDRLRTNLAGVRAVGDLVAGPQLAHRGFAHGIFVADDLAHELGTLSRPAVPVADHELPRITYSEPQMASVGLGEAAAREQYGDIEVRTMDLAGNARVQVLGGRGTIKLIRVVDGPVVGISAIGPGVGELMSEAQLIVGWDAHPEDVAGLIHAHPTLGEAMGEAHLALAGRPLHQH